MNRLKGQITGIDSIEHLSLVKIKVGISEFKSIVIDNPDTSSYLEIGREISVIFKESETVLATDLQGEISLQNRLEGKVISVDRGKILSTVSVDCSGEIITSVITTLSIDRLGIQEGVVVTVLIKTNEIVIAPEYGS